MLNQRDGQATTGELAEACARALIAGAHGVATRQQRRAAARRFVRQHRRDPSYLHWVLRSVSASSALAVALLGLAMPAAADMPLFDVQTGAANPLNAQDVGNGSAPSFGDLDGDGDLDLVSGSATGVFLYYENTGTTVGALYVARTGTANPLNGQDVGGNSVPALGDLDGDGDLDLVAGEYAGGVFSYFENTGNANSPSFVARTGAANPLDGQSVGTDSEPALADLDGDGDLDVMAGAYLGGFTYYENVGDATDPAFVVRTGTANPLPALDIGYHSAPAAADFDRDGDLDLVAGENDGVFNYFENTGSATAAAFVARTGAANPLDGQSVGYVSKPVAADLDGDGDADLVAGEFDGVFNAYQHLGGKFVRRTGAGNPLNGVSGGQGSKPALGDVDNDGDLDLVAGGYDGTLLYFQNTGSVVDAAFVQRSTGTANPLNGHDVGSFAMPDLGDLDADGDLDLVVGEPDGVFNYFENTGSLGSPAFVERTGAANPVSGIDIGGLSFPTLGDLDGDGDPDIVSGDFVGPFHYLSNVGSPTTPSFVVVPFGPQNPLDELSLAPESSFPELADFDGDGDLDLLATRAYFENTGSGTSAAFVERTDAAYPIAAKDAGDGLAASAGDLDGDGDVEFITNDGDGGFDYYECLLAQTPEAVGITGSANPLAGQNGGLLARPALGDLDADGDPDLVSGDVSGVFRYFENSGNAIGPAFVARTGAANPLDGEDVGYGYSAPSLGDLDGDGDLDLVSGEEPGGFVYYENTGDATSPVFVERTGAANPFDGLGTYGPRSAPALGDLDGDGDFDLVAGDSYGTFAYFENTGSASNPGFVAVTGAANPLDGLDVGGSSTPALADFDRDGDLDLAAGEGDGTLNYVKNQGSATAAVFVQLTGAANPFAGQDVGDASAPAAADLNGDGRPDLATGEVFGTFAVYYFPEPARGWLLGAGIALLDVLRRRRAR